MKKQKRRTKRKAENINLVPRKYISIKRELDVNRYSDLGKYLWANMEYARAIFNDGISYLKGVRPYMIENRARIQQRNDFIEDYDDYENKYYEDRKPYDFSVYFYRAFERGWKRYESFYVTGIRVGVCERLDVAKRAVDKYNYGLKLHEDENKHLNLKEAELIYHNYNKNKGSFEITDKHSNRIKVLDSKTLIFTVNNNGLTGHRAKPNQIILNLKESIYGSTNNYNSFNPKDIKKICFNYKFGRFFVTFVVVNRVEKQSWTSREPLAGIDLGARNPVTIHDGVNTYTLRHSEKTKAKIRRLEYRRDMLQSIRDRKTIGSRKYARVEHKLHKTLTRLNNIRDDWRKKTAFYIVNSYEEIIVDIFTAPVVDSKSSATSNVINKRVLDHGMGYFQDLLPHMATKYNCKMKLAPPDTTRTCSSCGFVNERLELKDNYLICKDCGAVIQRDENASINCYKSV